MEHNEYQMMAWMAA